MSDPTNPVLKQQVGGDHYKRLSIQPWQSFAAWFPETFPDYLIMEAIVYLARHHKKGGRESVEKAVHCLSMWLEMEPPNA